MMFRLKANTWGSEAARENLNERNICLKAFRSVPMSEVELLLPEKIISTRPSDQVK
jgi:hypothetical protein